MRGRLIGPKTWDRIVGIFLGFSLVTVTAQKIRGCLGLLIPDFYFKSCICMENAENGLLIGPKTWDRIMEIFLDIWDCP